MASDTIERIKERLSIVDVVSSYVELQQAGKNFKGKSPFTNEKTPSFYVSPDRGMYYCFSSSQGGDIFTFIEKMEGVEFKEALKILAAKAGIELAPEDPKRKTERDRLYDALEAATKFFEEYRDTNKEVLPYLENRGVNAETIAKWRIGYAPGAPHYGWRELKEHLEANGFTKDELLKAGLIKNANEGKEPYDLFRDRVMFPIFDQAGRVVAFSGRMLTQESEAPKYVNSPETELFNKSEILYGYDKAKNGIRSLGFALAVEGQFDVVLSHQAGYTNTVAVSGTALTAHHVMLLQRLTNRVVLSLDADKAGIAAVKRAADLMLPRGIDLKVAHIVGGKDPADLVHEDVQKFRKIVGGAKHVIEYFLDILEEQKKDDRNFKLRVREEVLPLLVKITNRIDQEHFEGVIAERLQTTKDAIHAEVARVKEKDTEGSKADADASMERPIVMSSDRLESYAEQVFGALNYLKRFEDQAHVHKNIYAKIQFVLDDQLSEFETKMDLERLNKTMMQFERTYESFPHKEFFNHLASKMNVFHGSFLKSQLTLQKEILKEQEQLQAFTETYEQALKKIQEINKKLELYQITDEEILNAGD